MDEFDFISHSDKPALLAISTRELRDQAKTALAALGYKVHCVEGHDLFHSRFYQINYQVIIIEETFGGGMPEDNASLKTVQTTSMAHRRHAVVLLLGGAFETLNALQAFAKSVHCVVNFSEMPLIGQLVEKTVAENDLFLSMYRQIQQTIHMQGK